MSGSSKELQITLGIQGKLHLNLTPISSFTLAPSTSPLDKLKNPIRLEGTCERIPDKTHCEVVLTREYEPATPRPTSRPGGREIHAEIAVTGTSFKVLSGGKDIELDTFEDELVGKGRLHCIIRPGLDGCNVDAPSPEVVLSFDNQVCFSFTLNAQTIGAKCTFTPTARTGFFKDKTICLALEEYDDPNSPQAKRGMTHPTDDFVWKAGDSTGISWRLGCRDDRDDPGLVDLVYPDPNEIPPFEYAYLVKAEVNGAYVTLPYPANPFAPSVPKPKLWAFDLALEDVPDPVASPSKQLKAKLGFVGFAADVAFGIEISFWRATVSGDQVTVEPAGVSRISDHYDASKDTCVYSVPSTLQNLDGCFAVVSFRGVATSATAVVDCKAADGYRGFAEETTQRKTGMLLDPTKGSCATTGITSKEAGAFLKIASYATDDLETLAMAMCIWTEARNNPDDVKRNLEMIHVGGVILNRKITKFWDKTTIVDIVLEPRQFSHFNTDNPEKAALKSKDVAQIRAWADALLGIEHDRFIECANVARLLIADATANPFASDKWIRHYYSPRSMTPPGSKPDWVTKLQEGVTCMPGGGEVAVAAIDKNNFRWYRGIY